MAKFYIMNSVGIQKGIVIAERVDILDDLVRFTTDGEFIAAHRLKEGETIGKVIID